LIRMVLHSLLKNQLIL